jgi:hypothetical protein
MNSEVDYKASAMDMVLRAFKEEQIINLPIVDVQGDFYKLYYGPFRHQLVQWMKNHLPISQPAFWRDYVLPAFKHGNNKEPEGIKSLDQMDVPDLVKVVLNNSSIFFPLVGKEHWALIHELTIVRNNLAHKGGLQPSDSVWRDIHTVMETAKAIGMDTDLQRKLENLFRETTIFNARMYMAVVL